MMDFDHCEDHIIEEKILLELTRQATACHFDSKGSSQTMKFGLTLLSLLILQQLLCALEVDGHKADRRVLSRLTALPEEEYFLAGIQQESHREAKIPAQLVSAEDAAVIPGNRLGAFFRRHERDWVRCRSQFIYGVSMRKFNSPTGFAQYVSLFVWDLKWRIGINAILWTFPKESTTKASALRVLSLVLKKLAVLAHTLAETCTASLVLQDINAARTLVAVLAACRRAREICPFWLYKIFSTIIVAPISEEIMCWLAFDSFNTILQQTEIVQSKTGEKLWFGQFELWHVLSSLAFSCAHMSNFLDDINEPSPAALAKAISKALFLINDCLFRRIPVYQKGGIYAAIGYHMAWNIFTCVLFLIPQLAVTIFIQIPETHAVVFVFFLVLWCMSS